MNNPEYWAQNLTNGNKYELINLLSSMNIAVRENFINEIFEYLDLEFNRKKEDVRNKIKSTFTGKTDNEILEMLGLETDKNIENKMLEYVNSNVWLATRENNIKFGVLENVKKMLNQYDGEQPDKPDIGNYDFGYYSADGKLFYWALQLKQLAIVLKHIQQDNDVIKANDTAYSIAQRCKNIYVNSSDINPDSLKKYLYDLYNVGDYSDYINFDLDKAKDIISSLLSKTK